MGRFRGVSLSSRPQRDSTEKEPEEPERTKNKERTRPKAGTFRRSSVRNTFWAVSSIGGTFWAVSSVGGTFRAVSRVGGALLAVLRVGGTFWGYLELVVGSTFLAEEAVKPNYGGVFSAVMQYGGGYVLAVGGFSLFGGNTLIWW